MLTAAFAFDVASYTALFVLITTGLVLMLKLVGLYNFAHGEFLLIGGLTLYALESKGVNPWLGIAAAGGVGVLSGLLLDRLLLRRVYQNAGMAILATFAVGLAIREAARYALGGQYVSVLPPVQGMLDIGVARFPAWRSSVLLLCLLLGTAVWLAFTYTGFGLRMRAALDNPRLSRASGISDERVATIAFCTAAGLAALSGALIAPTFSVNADMGLPFLVKGFLAAVLSSSRGIAGGLLAAAAIGALASVLPAFMSPVVADAVLLLGAVAVLRLCQNERAGRP